MSEVATAVVAGERADRHLGLFGGLDEVRFIRDDAMQLRLECKRFCQFGCLCAILAGCGDAAAPPVVDVSQRPAPATTAGEAAHAPSNASAEGSTETESPTSAVRATPQASTANNQTGVPPVTANADGEIPFVEEGTPEWRIYEITRLLAAPPMQKEVVSNAGVPQLVDRTAEEIAVDRQRNLAQIVSHAGQIIAATHADAAKESLFYHAVHYVSAAHVELALLGEADSARQLTEISEAIFAEKPKSPAAVEAAARLLELAQRMGERHGAANKDWVRAHATQARLFAQRFPLETSRCVTALLDAGRACEQVGLDGDARNCYLQLSSQFGDTPFADAVAAVVRRMNLVGSMLTAESFGGPTIDGGFITIDQFRGKHVLVVFWSGDSPTFANDFPRLQQLQQAHPDDLVIVGVNLDLNEATVDQFLESHPLKWRQIFDPDNSRRGTLNPVASYYGVTTVPLYWLIDKQGKVLAAPVDLMSVAL
jgi:peroxiredoxin